MRRKVWMGLVGLWFGFVPLNATAEDLQVKIYDMRSDMGVMQDFGPRGVCWTPEGHLMIADRRYNVFHIFDTEGRRYKFLGHTHTLGEAHYDALAPLEANVYLAAGNHYNFKNNTRIVTAHSVIHRMQVNNEVLTSDSAGRNLSPDRALRTTHFYGESPQAQLELQGLAVDPAHNRVFFGCAQPLNADGSLMLWEGKLDLMLAGDPSFSLTPLASGLKPSQEATLGKSYFLSDLTYVPDKGLAILLTSQGEGEKRFGSNQIWFMKSGSEPAKLVEKDLVPGNRATGVAIRATENDEFQAAVVCDNNSEDSHIPSRLVMIRGLRLPMR